MEPLDDHLRRREVRCNCHKGRSEDYQENKSKEQP